MSQETQKKHQTKMARKKKVVDEGINRADREQGLLLVLTGNGKGKSSSAFGMIARALGHGMKVGVAQFIKGSSDTGEESFFKNHPRVTWHVLGEGFTWETQNLEKDRQTAEKGWDVARQMLHDPSYDLIVLDELTYPLRYKWLDMDKVLADLQARHTMQHVVVTAGWMSASVIWSMI